MTDWWVAPPTRRERRITSVLVLAVMAVLMLAQLGHAALWDDEANTALYAQAVWHSGDTSAVHGTNVVGYRDGVELDSHLRNRLVAPLAYFVAAPFVRDTRSAWWARIPFVLAGLATVYMGLHWIANLAWTRRRSALVILAVTGNVSFILFSRQARYYALATLFAVLLTYCYVNRERPRYVLAGTLCAIALLATHYLAFAGTAVALAFDYLVWGRRNKPIAGRIILFAIGTLVVAATPIVATWYPLGKQIAPQVMESWIVNRGQLFIATLRDMNACELGVGVLILAGIALYRREQLATRLIVAVVLATATVTVFSPQPDGRALADIRYVSFLIPACIAIGVLVLDSLPLATPLILVAAAIAFHTTALELPISFAMPSEYRLCLRSTTALYLGELVDPPSSSYAIAAAWLREHAKPGDTAITVPDFATYPLMFHAPHVTYGWQFTPQRAAYLSLPAIHVRAAEPPTWIIAFEAATSREQHLADGTVVSYELIATLPARGVDASRAELYWHRFEDSASLPAVTIWRRSTR